MRSKVSKTNRRAEVDIPIRIDPQASVRPIDQTHRRSHLELAAACLVEQAAPHPRLQKVQFRLALFSLQTQQKLVIKQGGIVKTVGIQDQSAGVLA